MLRPFVPAAALLSGSAFAVFSCNEAPEVRDLAPPSIGTGGARVPADALRNRDRLGLEAPLRAFVLAAALACGGSALADPNPDVECRSTGTSFVAVKQCIEAERRARNEASCLDALVSWPEDKPCPPVWFRAAVLNLREGRPCAFAEVRQ
jgi:hypothetical protein